MDVPIDMEQKEDMNWYDVASMYGLELWPPHYLDFGLSRLIFEIIAFQELVWLTWNERDINE